MSYPVIQINKITMPDTKEERMKLIENSVGKTIRHFQGDYYKIEGIAIDTSSPVYDAKVVIYTPLYDSDLKFTRDLEDCAQELSPNDYLMYGQKYVWNLVSIDSVRQGSPRLTSLRSR